MQIGRKRVKTSRGRLSPYAMRAIWLWLVLLLAAVCLGSDLPTELSLRCISWLVWTRGLLPLVLPTVKLQRPLWLARSDSMQFDAIRGSSCCGMGFSRPSNAW